MKLVQIIIIIISIHDIRKWMLYKYSVCIFMLLDNNHANTRGGQVIFEQTVGSICIEVDI